MREAVVAEAAAAPVAPSAGRSVVSELLRPQRIIIATETAVITAATAAATATVVITAAVIITVAAVAVAVAIAAAGTAAITASASPQYSKACA